tara:strand:- start:3933 stop:4475 length:543 start_codon:yes stop_codon:yes gene_type:complete
MSDNEDEIFELDGININIEPREDDSPVEESEPSTEEEEDPTPSPEPVKRTKTGRVKKKASPKTAERLRKQLAAGRAKSLETRRKNKKLRELAKRKKMDEEDQKLLEELQERKSNAELREEIKKLKEQMKNKEIPEEHQELPPKPMKKNTIKIDKKEDLPPVVQRRIKSHLPFGGAFFKPK